MYEKLIGLMAIRKVTKVAIAEAMGINRSTLDNKLEGKTRFSTAEMFFIQQKFFPDVVQAELFTFVDKPA